MRDCDYSSGCVDVYIWIAVTILIVVITFLFCCRVCRIFPLLCGNEIEIFCRSSREDASAATAAANKAGATDLRDSDANTTRVAVPNSAEVRIEMSIASRQEGRQQPQPKQPHLAIKLATRCTCAIALGYIIAIIIVVIVSSITDPFPAVPATACAATCQTSDAYCCTYNPPFVHEDIYFNMPDGTKLHGWWIPSSNGSNGNLLYNHGSGNNIAAMYRILRYQVSKFPTSSPVRRHCAHSSKYSC
jgi:hypothetical protein